MSERFEVGEVAISIPWGIEVTITSKLTLRVGKHSDTGELYEGMMYSIEPSDGRKSRTGARWGHLPKQLRKKEPPREDLQLVRWSECPWQPKKVTE